MKILNSFTSLSIILFFCISCSESTETPQPKPFDLSLDPVEASMTIDVIYSADKIDICTFDNITYVSNDGEQLINNPALPWELKLQVDKGVSVYMKARGSITSGRVYIKLEGFGQDGGSTQEFTDSTGTEHR